MNRTAMSPVSAVQSVVQWIQTHGQPPSRSECRASNGLPHYQTFQYACGGLTRAVSLALAYVEVGSAALSQYEAAQRELCLCNVRTTACLRCGTSIPWEGPHIRQCNACRRRPADENAGAVHWGSRRPAWSSETLDELIDWSTL